MPRRSLSEWVLAASYFFGAASGLAPLLGVPHIMYQYANHALVNAWLVFFVIGGLTGGTGVLLRKPLEAVAIPFFACGTLVFAITLFTVIPKANTGLSTGLLLLGMTLSLLNRLLKVTEHDHRRSA